MTLHLSRLFLCESAISQRCFSLSPSSFVGGGGVHYKGSISGTIAKKKREAKLNQKDHYEVSSESTGVQSLTSSNENDSAALTSVPEEHVVTRRVRVFRPARNAMQSGNVNTKLWSIEFDNRERWENPTMGWGSSADPLSNISMAMTFKSKEDAVTFVERQGWTCFVDEAKEKKMRPKSYAINFAWNKRTRRAMK